jgi:hypothetical protein
VITAHDLAQNYGLFDLPQELLIHQKIVQSSSNTPFSVFMLCPPPSELFGSRIELPEGVNPALLQKFVKTVSLNWSKTWQFV